MLNISELDTVGELYGIHIAPLINLYGKKRKRTLKVWRKNKDGGVGGRHYSSQRNKGKYCIHKTGTKW